MSPVAALDLVCAVSGVCFLVLWIRYVVLTERHRPTEPSTVGRETLLPPLRRTWWALWIALVASGGVFVLAAVARIFAQVDT